MARTFTYNGTDYRVRTTRGDRYIVVPIELVTAGARLDMGVFAGRSEAMWNGAVNPNTWEIDLAGGVAYTESRGATVRVWID